jgi:hypothetical protein
VILDQRVSRRFGKVGFFTITKGFAMTLRSGGSFVRFEHKEGVYEGRGLRFSWTDGKSYEYNVYIGSLDPKAKRVQWCLSGRDLLNTTDRQTSSFKLGTIGVELKTVMIRNQHGFKVSCAIVANLPKDVAKSFQIKPFIVSSGKKKKVLKNARNSRVSATATPGGIGSWFSVPPDICVSSPRIYFEAFLTAFNPAAGPAQPLSSKMLACMFHAPGAVSDW